MVWGLPNSVFHLNILTINNFTYIYIQRKLWNWRPLHREFNDNFSSATKVCIKKAHSVLYLNCFWFLLCISILTRLQKISAQNVWQYNATMQIFALLYCYLSSFKKWPIPIHLYVICVKIHPFWKSEKSSLRFMFKMLLFTFLESKCDEVWENICTNCSLLLILHEFYYLIPHFREICISLTEWNEYHML